MCGIVGYIGKGQAGEVILEGLKKLEYRGYDSAGMAIMHDGEITLLRSEGKMKRLVELSKKTPHEGHIGIGHTRWATHGRPSEANAHPHLEAGVAVVHNGIIENYLALRKELSKGGAEFKSETDTEILAHLIAREMRATKDLESAVIRALKLVKGTYALAVISKDDPDKIVGARMECPLVVGLDSEEAVISSDIPAIMEITKEAIFLNDGEVVTITKDTIDVKTLEGVEVTKTPRTIDWSPVMAEKDGYRHFMLKEIFEQPRAVTDTFRGQVMEEEGDVFFEGFEELNLKDIERIYIIACGTSWHSALIGKFLIEEFTGIPTEVDLASEFRYRDPLASEKTLIIAISQSGETADTLAAIKEAKRKGAPVVAICNVIESSISRESLKTIYTHAGPEIGVASTKAFTTQLTALYLFAIYVARRRATMDKALGVELIQELTRLPHKIEAALHTEEAIKKIAKKYFHSTDFLYLARGINYPIALEGALKLKEISYIHAEGYPAGEMKHGPIALIDEDMPVVVVATRDAHYPKVVANMEEVKARGGSVIAVVNDDDIDATAVSDDVIIIPHTSHHLSPILTALPLQLLAYHIAVLKGTDVDQPRNLAKSVTVE